jgi:hypothetical protein
MTFAELFRGYWWLIFPLFGMFMAFWGMFSSERRTRHLLELMKSYSDQGKDPPPDLVRMVAQSVDEYGVHTPSSPQNRMSERLWSFVTFAALAAGFATAYAFTNMHAEDWSWVFLAVAVAMGVMAIGALAMLLFGPKP